MSAHRQHPDDNVDIRHLPGEHAFALYDGDARIGRIDYAREGTGSDSVIDLHHTEVDKEYGGRGLAGRLVRTAADHFAAEADQPRLKATCPYARGWLSRHTEDYGRIFNPEFMKRLQGGASE